ncbi:MAG: metallophosphoesterase family protein [Planctomycetota bacterium]
MRLALISDIHSNTPALEAVLADIAGQECENILCLGDVIGYGPHPGACIDMVQERCSACLKGNHEEALLDGNEAANFNPRARRAIDWTRQFIQSDGDTETQQRRWQLFETLKTQARSGSFFFVHASPRDPTKEYVLPRESRNAEKMGSIFGMIEHLCFVGHTHVAGVFLPDGSFTPPDKLWGSTYFIDPDEKALINVGSVGQPRDNDTRACYCVIDSDDTESPRVYFRRVEYDLEPTIQDILANPMLDNSLAERLRHGR